VIIFSFQDFFFFLSPEGTISGSSNELLRHRRQTNESSSCKP